MKDKLFLAWIHERLEIAHNESPNMDYMHKLRAVIRATPPDQDTPVELDLNLRMATKGMFADLVEEDSSTPRPSLEDLIK